MRDPVSGASVSGAPLRQRPMSFGCNQFLSSCVS